MKQLFISVIILACSWQIHAQCIVDAGPARHLCESDTTLQVLNASIIQGTAPYKIAWSYTYGPIPGIMKEITASDCLTDTTILNPSIRGIVPRNRIILIKIEVEDSTGATCSDLAEVTFSEFYHNLEITPKFVAEGDSVQLCFPSHSYGGFKPYQSYVWIYNEDISGNDTTSCIYTKPVFKNDCWPLFNGYIGKRLDVFAKDAYGCIVTDEDYVALLTTGLSENADQQPWCIFDGERGNLHIVPESPSQRGTVSVFDMSGRRVFQQPVQGETTLRLADKLNEVGMYSIVFEVEGGAQFLKKIFFTQH